MGERRSLIDGLKASEVDPQLAHDFVYNKPERTKPKVGKPAMAETPPALPAPAPSGIVNRAQFSTRVRTDLAAQIKRLALERELAGRQPHSLQEIVEEALSTWLAGQGDRA